MHKLIKRFLPGFIFIILAITFVLMLTGESKPLDVRTQKDVYSPDEAIVVEFSGLPGNSTDWITVVKDSTPDNQYCQWFYTQGKQCGELKFKGLPDTGNYEVRVYFNWPKEGYNVKARYPFKVKNMAGVGVKKDINK